VEDGPIFKSPSKQVAGDPEQTSEVTSSNFFHCLKLAAENVIFPFAPITECFDSCMPGGKQARSESEFMRNFLARLKHFSMVITMANKKDRQEGEGEEDKSAQTSRSRRRKSKRLLT
jgi:hypothetical protein